MQNSNPLQNETPTVQVWGSRIGLILAMAGNSVGLGNFLRFPVQAIQNGGGAFIIPYLVCFLMLGIPLLWIEWASGRFGGKYGYHATPFIFEKMGNGSKFWKYSGVLGIFATTGVATYYCYIESWTLSYVFKSISQTFFGLNQTQVADYFGKYVGFETTFLGLPFESVIFYIICIVLNCWILSKGLKGGIEKAAKIGMPLLLLFGAFLAIIGLTLGTKGAPAGCTDCDANLGLNFLWQPQFTSLYDPKVWLAAAGQIFFTLSVGMGCIHSYAAFVKSEEDIALNSMSAGWMNEFVEIVIGSSIVIPIACGYLGIDWVLKNAGFSIAFQTMPFLFSKWGVLLGTFAGIAWFGLLFFAGITSSLAMGTPWISFLEDEFRWSKKKAALSLGVIIFIVGLPTVLFFKNGVFDEYDYWTGTFSLFLFALLETILFAWVFGIDKGWDELTKGADIRLPLIYKPIIKYITPSLLILIFIGSCFNPVGNNWKKAFEEKWEFDPSSIIGKIQNKSIVYNKSYFADYKESEVGGIVTKIGPQGEDHYFIQIGKLDLETGEIVSEKKYVFHHTKKIQVQQNQSITAGVKLAKGSFVNNIFYIDLSRVILILFFGLLVGMVWHASRKRKRRSIGV